MKRNLLLNVLCLVCALLLCACGGGSTSAVSPSPSPTAAPAETAPAEASTAPGETSEPLESSVPSETAESAASPEPVATLPDAGLVPDKGTDARSDSLLELAQSYVDRPLSELQEEIGEPLSSSYVSSCLIPGGQDGELQYDGFIVSTVKSGDSETVLDVRAD